ncbi:DUF2130 domain-containing protein [Agromyces sp. MMS24-JH15]|uniref:DUF2130 domain-containing protein n=1 Tax=Agromyces sp. MMS24-JH15 TaxID=3243765 RepID=UPI003747878E
MNEIKCPHCGTKFTIDEAEYASLVQQVRTAEFDKELHARLAEADTAKKAEIALAEAKVAQQAQQAAAEKDVEIQRLKNEIEGAGTAKSLAIAEAAAQAEKALGDKDGQIERLKAQIEAAGTAEALAVAKAGEEAQRAAAEKDVEIQRLKNEIEGAGTAKALAIAEAAAQAEKALGDKDGQIERLKAQIEAAGTAEALAVAKAGEEAQRAAAEKDAEIQQLKAEIDKAGTVQELAVTKAVQVIQQGLDAAENKLALQAAQQLAKESALKDSHSKEVALLQEQVEQYRDFKAKQSVKLLGESLEQHCENVFNLARAMGFPNAKFGKDNDASSGTKGDYIFRDFSADGVEYLSIMFDMKNEADATATKKRNVDFLAKLDKDRREKGCEYAVLVSMLEEDSELYTGITDVSHEYPKMFVVRPQFFLPLIALLRNATQDTIQVKAELELVKQQNIDITNFEANLLEFQTRFSKNVSDARTQYNKAIDTIDDAIKKLEATKEALRLWAKHLGTASGRANDLTIRALTRGNETMKAQFAELEVLKESEGPGEPEAA